MSIAEAWSKAYARQADADLSAWERYEKHPKALAAECHRLLFLQMACEKLCKSYLLRAGTSPASVQTSHRYIARPLPLLIREEMIFRRNDLRGIERLLPHIRHLANEIEVLSPSIDRGGVREDNCEYPWASGGRILSPLDQTFAPSQLMVLPAGRTFLKLLRLAIDRALA